MTDSLLRRHLPNGRRTRRCGSVFRAIPSCGSAISSRPSAKSRRSRRRSTPAARARQVWLVAAHDGAAESARKLAPFAEVIVEPFGDIWLRDTGPIVLGSGKQRRAQGFGFNGWGGKYDLDGDQDIGERLARDAGLPFAKADWVLEGGAIDGDGSGTVVTTEQCLLNPNRNTADARARSRAAARRPRLRARDLARLGPAERPYRRPRRQSRPLRRAGPGRHSRRRRRTIPTRRSTRRRAAAARDAGSMS